MTERIYTGAEAMALIDGANNVTLADPGHHCGGSFVECSLAGDCDGEHPTGRLTMLEVDHGEESERIYFAEPKDAALCAAAKGLAASVAHHEKRAESAEALAQIHREERDACAAEAVRLTAERDAARAMVECEANDVVVLRRDLDALRAAVLELREAESARDDLPLDEACDSLVAATSRVVHARVALIELVPGAPAVPS